MSTLKLWLTIGTVLATLFSAVAGFGYVQHLKREAAELRADQAEQQLATARDDLEQVRQREAEKERQRAALAATQQQLEHALADRTTTIRRLQRENEELRQWADQPLPEPVARLRERPALTGAAAYQQYLRNTGALPAVSERPPD